MIAIPEDFAAGILNQAGDAGRDWLDRLPGILESLCTRWNLVVDGASLHGYLGLVVPVTRGAELCALKVSWLDESNVHEIPALAAWNGRGVVRLLEADARIGALLLERLDGRRSLRDVEVGEAVTIDAHLIRCLSVPAPNGLPLLKSAAERLIESIPERWQQMNHPIPRPLIDATSELAAQLGPAAGSLMVNYDLHDGNVLAGEREPWLAIDPKVVVGDPEYGLAQLLWTRLEDMERAGGLNRHFRALVDLAGLDLPRARSWTLVRCVDYWLWALSVGLTEDPVRCEVITASLTS